MSTVVELSDDRKLMVIRIDSIRTVKFHSRDEDGFTDRAVQMALDFDYTSAKEVEPGTVKRSYLKHFFGTPVYFHINTGPPTWWAPRIEVGFRERRAMIGWLRGLVAVAVDPKKGDDDD